ncbi:MAG: IS4 family transposase [Bacteroidia bacterium]|nr:IS4 family transposase [Bacteroidia bacterium]
MNTKVDYKRNELVSIFSEKTGWNLARVKFLVSFILTICKLQTVCFTKIAQGLEAKPKTDSNLRRIQRFFAKFVIDEDLIAKLIMTLLPIQAPYRLSLDRTNWKFGKANINILMFSVCYHGVGIPLIWKMLDKRGNSNSKERIELISRYIRLFGTGSIEGILADREFIGNDWIRSLIGDKIHFYIRIKGNMWVYVPGLGEKKAFWLFNDLRLNQYRNYREIVRIDNQYVYLSGVKIYDQKEKKIEFVIIATYCYDCNALIVYKDRWQTETLFKSLKSSGFNMEDTHLTDPERISKLLSLICIAFVWVYQMGVQKHENIAPIKIKTHGRRAYSYFKYGLIFFAHALLCSVLQDIDLAIKILSCT